MTQNIPGQAGEVLSRGHNGPEPAALAFGAVAAGVRTTGGSLQQQAGPQNHGTDQDIVRALRHASGEVRAAVWELLKRAPSRPEFTAVVCTVRNGRPYEATCPACLLPYRVVHGWLAAHGPHVDGRRQLCPGSRVPVREVS